MERPTLRTFKSGFVALPSAAPPPPLTNPVSSPNTDSNTGDCLNPGHQGSERGPRGCQQWGSLQVVPRGAVAKDRHIW